MASISPFIQALGETGYIETRTLGARNPVTNQPTVSYTAYDEDDYDPDDFDCATETSIFIDDLQTREITTDAGRVTEKTLRGYLPGDASIHHLDRLAYHGETYVVTSVPTVERLLGEPVYIKVELTRVT